jgi:hypothetical protein
MSLISPLQKPLQKPPNTVATHVMTHCGTGRPERIVGPARLTECEAFLLRSGRKALALERLRW